MEASSGSLNATNERRDLRASSSGVRTPSRRRAETDDSELAGRVWAREVNAAWDPCILALDGGGIRGYSSLLILKELMHEVWLCEKRLEEEEASGMEISARGPRKSSHNNGVQTDLWLADDGPTPHTEPLPLYLRNKPSIEEFPAASNLLNADCLTTDFTKLKALSEEELLPCHYFDFMYGTSTGGLIATLLGRLRMTTTECLEIYRKVGDDLFGRKRSSIPLMTKYYHEPLEKAVQDIVGKRCREHESCDGTFDLHPWYLEDNVMLGESQSYGLNPMASVKVPNSPASY